MLHLASDIKQKGKRKAYISCDLHFILRSNYAIGSFVLSHDLVTIHHFSTLTLKGTVATICTTRFNTQQFYVLPTQCIYVFCVNLRTNSDYFSIQHKLAGFYNRDGMYLL
jgi:hypothetical protein